MKMLLFYILVSLLQINLSWSAFQLNNAAIIATPLLRSSHVSTTTSNDAINSKAKKSNHISKRAFRNLNFWTRAGRIYSTYKLFQIKMTSQKVLGMIRGNVRNANETKLAWDHQHEINSQRMIDLCLGLRGFYLKTGQFLGSRYVRLYIIPIYN
jgi:predicted unusual protein kinase regulating ubiquinone biosynthesis (AarF/ABC1/UbiB family)